MAGGGVLALLAFDIFATAVISMGFILVVLAAARQVGAFNIRDIVLGDHVSSLFFYSAFFTSVWLWLYAASVLVSRVLVRLSGGVGFLLKVTDVEIQPFRSMGFTSVVLVSLLFLVGLPFVLLA